MNNSSNSKQKRPPRNPMDKTPAQRGSAKPVKMAAPQSVLNGAWIAVAECTLGLGYGALLVIRDLLGYEHAAAIVSVWGTGLWFFLIFGAVLTGAIFLLRGSSWGRGPIIMLNLCLVGVAYYMFTSGALTLAIPTIVVALAALYCMFNPKAVDWAASIRGL